MFGSDASKRFYFNTVCYFSPFMKYLIPIGVLLTGWLAACRPAVPEPQETIAALQQLNQLATAEYVFTKTLQASDELTWYKVGDRKILINVRAGVKAGVDLSQLSVNDIDVTGKGIKITMPPATILSINIKPEDVSVAYQQTGFFRDQFSPAEVNEVMRVGERQIMEAAAKTDILKQADNNAALLIDKTLRQLGYESITLERGISQPTIIR